MFIAVALELMFGLRKGELPKVKWDWFDTIEGVPMLRCQAVSVKGRTNEINIVALDPFWRIFNRTLERNHWRGQPGDYCLAERVRTVGRSARSPGLVFAHGGPTDRNYWPAVDVGHWLRWLGWTSQKTNHALRDYGASLITMRFGLDAASRWCRHRNRATTESHYSRFVELGKIASPIRLRWIRWGK
jgi:integrase